MSGKEKDTEHKIKEAARILFLEKGFDKTKTRDIAEASGINLALLNYYFRGKRKLYEIIMLETMQSFFTGLLRILNDEDTTLEEKVEAFVGHYIDMLSNNPNILHFILNYVREDPQGYNDKINMLDRARGSHFFKQFMQAAMEGKVPSINPIHFILNVMGLVVFPFLAQPMIELTAGISSTQFQNILAERKRLIPLWVKEMLEVQ